jgi:hypothetical protein
MFMSMPGVRAAASVSVACSCDMYMEVDMDLRLDLDVVMVMVIVRRTWDMENKQIGCLNARMPDKSLVWHHHCYSQFTTLV